MSAEPCSTTIRCLSPCCTAPCMPAVPFCQPMKIQYVGEPKLCSILCRQGVDEPLRIDVPRKYRCRGPNPRTEKLGYPVGVLRSLVASSDKALFFDEKEMNGQRYAMCLKAYALLHILPIVEWNRSALDSLMIEGAELYAQQPAEHFRKSLEGGGAGDAATVVWDETIYSKDEALIRRFFKLRGYEFEIELSEKFTLEGSPGTGDSPPDINVITLKPALKKYFTDKQYCLLSTNNLYLLIWQSMGMYFVLDFYGRTQEKLQLLRDGGYATLLSLRGLNNVYYFIAVMTTLGKRDLFTLRDLRITLMVDPEGRTQMRAFSSKRREEYVEVTEGYAYLKSDLHLSLKEKDPLLSRCGLPVAVAAIMASKIDHPGTWDEKIMNKIICYGFFVCRCCWDFCQNSRTPIDLNSFPNQLQMGQFAVNITLIPQVLQGTWHCLSKYEPTELSDAITECFDQGYNHLILSVNQQNYAIFKKNNFYYLFDPYRHRLPFLNTRSASLRMFNSLSDFFKVLNLSLLESNPTSPFFLHRAVVTDIRLSPTGECVPSPPTQVCPDELQDALSINEAICFREDYKRCLADLGQISEDDEEESFDEDDMEWPEEEAPKGEEEGGELSGFDEGTDSDHRKRRRRGRRGGMGGRGRRGGRDKRRRGKGKDGESPGRRGRSKSQRGKGKRREKAGTTDSEDDGKRTRKGSRSRASRRSSRRRSSRRRSSRRRSSRRRSSRRRSSRRRSSRRRSSRRGSRDSKSLASSKTRKSRAGSKSRGSKSRGSKSRGSKSRGSKSRGSKSRGSRSRGSRSRGSRSRDGSRRRSSSRRRKSGDRSGKKGGIDGSDGGRDGDGDGGRDGGDRQGGRDRDRDGGREGDRDGGRDGDRGDRGDRDGDRDGGRRRRDGDDGDEGSDDFYQDGRGKRRRSDYDGDDREGGRYGDGRDGDRYGRSDEYDRFGKSGYDDDFDRMRDSRDSDMNYDSDERERRRRERQRKREAKEGGPSKPNTYPGYSCIPYNLAVCGSESGTYESICKLLRAGFKCADRVLVMTPWGNFVVFRICNMSKKMYFIYDGCTCNVERFRHLDLNCGTAGLISFNNLHRTIMYLLDTRKIRTCLHKSRQQVIDEICNRYCQPAKPAVQCY